jgi:hypothetical protein
VTDGGVGFTTGLMRKLLLVVVLAALALACGGGKRVWAVQPVTGPVTIQPEEVWVRGGKLWVRVVVVNNTGAPIVVDRDQIVAHLPNGAVVRRAEGTYTQHMPYVIPPGAGHPVYVEFYGEGFNWRDVPNAQVDFSPGVTTNGQPVAVPPLTVANQ